MRPSSTLTPRDIGGLQCGIRTHIIPRPKRGAITRLGEPEKLLAGVIGFEPMILISKTSALGQTKLNPNINYIILRPDIDVKRFLKIKVEHLTYHD